MTTLGKGMRRTEPPLGREEAEAILSRLASVFLHNTPPSPENVDNSDNGLPSRESMYRILVEQILAVVFIAYLDGGISEAYVSPQIEKTLGFSQEEWLEDPIRWYRQVHPEDKDRWSMDAAHLFLTGDRFRSAYRVIARNGSVVWFDCEIRMVRRKDGRPWCIHGVGFDISELKRAEEALRERTAAFRNLSSRLLQLQDQEHRKIARELHDSLGQYLAALKMSLDGLRQRHGSSADPAWAESQNILEGCLRRLDHILPIASPHAR